MTTDNEIPLVVLSVIDEEDGSRTFQSAFNGVLNDEMTEEERETINTAIDELITLIEPVFDRVDDDVFGANEE